MLFMDWRDDHLHGSPQLRAGNEVLPTFLYAMPFRWAWRGEAPGRPTGPCWPLPPSSPFAVSQAPGAWLPRGCWPDSPTRLPADGLLPLQPLTHSLAHAVGVHAH
jgi:hypothetical protein